jgi:hypothetical protein
MIIIGFVLCSAVAAYTPMLIIRECPHCNAHVVQEETVSGNTIGATYWTDGKREAKMLPDHPWLAKCPMCNFLFWIDESVEVDSGFDAAKGKQQVMAPSEKEILEFISGPAFPANKELYVRVSAWRSANDAWRRNPNATPAFSKEQVQNLKSLSAMLDESEPNQRILKAEIARELGEFDECLGLLSHPFDEGYAHAVGFIKKLAEAILLGWVECTCKKKYAGFPAAIEPLLYRLFLARHPDEVAVETFRSRLAHPFIQALCLGIFIRIVWHRRTPGRSAQRKVLILEA